jgi:hypothetical protein
VQIASHIDEPSAIPQATFRGDEPQLAIDRAANAEFLVLAAHAARLVHGTDRQQLAAQLTLAALSHSVLVRYLKNVLGAVVTELNAGPIVAPHHQRNVVMRYVRLAQRAKRRDEGLGPTPDQLARNFSPEPKRRHQFVFPFEVDTIVRLSGYDKRA